MRIPNEFRPSQVTLNGIHFIPHTPDTSRVKTAAGLESLPRFFCAIWKNCTKERTLWGGQSIWNIELTYLHHSSSLWLRHVVLHLER